MTGHQPIQAALALALTPLLASCGGKTVAYESDPSDPEAVYASYAEPGSGGASSQGAALVPLPGGFAIDRTEVTRGQYAEFLLASHSLEPQQGLCDWNTTLEPDPQCLANDTVCHGDDCGAHPQVCVDWCDAKAYCEWAGKRLCGHVDGGPADFDGIEDPTTNQWFHACTSGGAYQLIYGDAPDSSRCNTSFNPQTGCDGGQGGSGGGPAGTCRTVEVASLPGCTSDVESYAGVFDLSGNVWEWEDACEGPSPSDSCRVRGGSFYYGAYDRCGEGGGTGQPRSGTAVDVGFRCCSR